MHPQIRPCREVRRRWSTFCLHITAHWCKRDSLWRVRRSRGTHVRGASCAASVAIMRTALSVEWTRYGVVDPSARRQCQRLCTASRVDRSRQRQSEPRSAVLAALPQLQGPTEVPNMQRAVAHCHLMVVGGHVDSSGTSGRRQQSNAGQGFTIVCTRESL